jgi:hypothetical protein
MFQPKPFGHIFKHIWTKVKITKMLGTYLLISKQKNWPYILLFETRKEMPQWTIGKIENRSPLLSFCIKWALVLTLGFSIPFKPDFSFNEFGSPFGSTQGFQQFISGKRTVSWPFWCCGSGRFFDRSRIRLLNMSGSGCWPKYILAMFLLEILLTEIWTKKLR